MLSLPFLSAKKDAPSSALYDTPAYRRSRMAYNLQCAFEYFMTLLVGDAYLAKLLGYLGMEDAAVGVLSSFVNAAFLIQLFSLPLSRRSGNAKPLSTVVNTASQFFFALLFFLPFTPFSAAVRRVLAALLLLLGFGSKYLVTTILFRWANAYVDPARRASFSAAKEMTSLLGGVFFALSMGFLLDRYEAAGNLPGGFLCTGCVALGLGVCSCFCLTRVEKEKPAAPVEKSWRKVCAVTFGNAAFRHVLVVTALMSLGNLCVPFLGTFKTVDLLLSVGAVQVIQTAACLARFALSPAMGRLSDRTSFAHGMEVALALSAVSYGFLTFATPNTVWCVVVYSILYAVSQAGISQNSLNLVYSYVPMAYFVEATAIKSSVSGVCSLLVTMGGGFLLSRIQAQGGIFGFPLYGQQVLAVLSLLSTVAAALYCRLVLEKCSVMKQ